MPRFRYGNIKVLLEPQFPQPEEKPTEEPIVDNPSDPPPEQFHQVTDFDGISIEVLPPPETIQPEEGQ